MTITDPPSMSGKRLVNQSRTSHSSKSAIKVGIPGSERKVNLDNSNHISTPNGMIITNDQDKLDHEKIPTEEINMKSKESSTLSLTDNDDTLTSSPESPTQSTVFVPSHHSTYNKTIGMTPESSFSTEGDEIDSINAGNHNNQPYLDYSISKSQINRKSLRNDSNIELVENTDNLDKEIHDELLEDGQSSLKNNFGPNSNEIQQTLPNVNNSSTAPKDNILNDSSFNVNNILKLNDSVSNNHYMEEERQSYNDQNELNESTSFNPVDNGIIRNVKEPAAPISTNETNTVSMTGLNTGTVYTHEDSINSSMPNSLTQTQETETSSPIDINKDELHIHGDIQQKDATLENKSDSSKLNLTNTEVSNDKALLCKLEGNAFLKAGDITEAILSYTRGIEADPNSYILYSNRSGAYSMQENYIEALKNADECVKLQPNFAKGHSRRATTLFALKRYAECIEAAKMALSLHLNNPDLACNSKLLERTLEDARKQLIGSVLSGKWKGTVDTEFGGYEQVFEFDPITSRMVLTVMERPVNATYYLLVNNTPMGMDITAEPDAPSQAFMPPPTVPYIFELSYKSPETGERVYYTGTTSVPISSCDNTETEESTNEILQWEMKMCAPYMTLSRASEFKGPGVVVMKKFFGEDTIKIDPEIEKLSFDNQLVRYLQELLEVHPDRPLEEPAMLDDQEVAATKIALFIRTQAQIFNIAKRYPDSVSIIGEQLLRLGAEQINDITQQSVDIPLTIKEETLSPECQTLLGLVRTHIGTSGIKLLQLARISPEISAQAISSKNQSKLESSMSSKIIGSSETESSINLNLPSNLHETLDTESNMNASNIQNEDRIETTFEKIKYWMSTNKTLTTIGASIGASILIGGVAWIILKKK